MDYNPIVIHSPGDAVAFTKEQVDFCGSLKDAMVVELADEPSVLKLYTYGLEFRLECAYVPEFEQLVCRVSYRSPMVLLEPLHVHQEKIGLHFVFADQLDFQVLLLESLVALYAYYINKLTRAMESFSHSSTSTTVKLIPPTP